MKPVRFIALDIGSENIGLAVFAAGADRAIELLDYGIVPIDANPPAEMAREALVATALKRLLDDKKPAVRNVCVCIEGQAVFSRLVKLPPVPPDRMRQTIHHEAVQHIPFPLGEVVWDAHVADPAASEPEILLAAVKADLVEGLVAAIEANGLSIKGIDVAPAALANAVRFNYPDLAGPVLVVDAGRHSTNLVFLDGARTFLRTLPVSAGMSARLVHEIERSITFYRTQQGGNAPRRILVAGGLESLAAEAGRLGLPVEAFDPLRRISTRLPKSGLDGMGVLAGLAARFACAQAIVLDLLPDALKAERKFKRRLPLWAACGTAALLIGLVWIAGLHQMNRALKAKVGEVGKNIHALRQVEKQLLPREARIRELEERTETYRAAVERRTFWLEALQELRERLPEGMFLLQSEPLREGDRMSGMRVTVLSYLDKEPEGKDAVLVVRDALRESARFNEETRVFSRPTKQLFARRFVLDLFFKEPPTP